METHVIFGATGGIGSTLAKTLSEEGKRVLLCSRNEEKLIELSDLLNQPYLICDGCDEQKVSETISKIKAEYGQIDGIANCIGSFFIHPLHSTSLLDWNEVLRVNLTSCFGILKHGFLAMEEKKEGSIVLISSCAAQIGLMHHEAISAAKGAVEALVRSSAASSAKKGIRVNGVAPGLIDTPLSAPLTKNEGALKASIALHPLGRIGKPEDVASLIAYLLSKKSHFLTGEIISMDGGLSHLKLLS